MSPGLMLRPYTNIMSFRNLHNNSLLVSGSHVNYLDRKDDCINLLTYATYLSALMPLSLDLSLELWHGVVVCLKKKISGISVSSIYISFFQV